MTILEEIVNNRQRLLQIEKQSLSEKEIIQQSEDLLKSDYRPEHFLNSFKSELPFLIAEIKKSSPSKGIIRKDFDLDYIAKAYKSSIFVNAISVLTEPDYFSGHYEYIKRVKEIANKPILMKDFIIDKYQIYRAFILGASAIILISAVLDDSKIDELSKLAWDLNMNVLFETHSPSEYKRALNFDFDLIGINNRDLKTFVTDINTSIKILDGEGKPEGKTIISESGIHSKKDIRMLWINGVDGFLVGEYFMKHKNISKAIADLFGESYE